MHNKCHDTLGTREEKQQATWLAFRINWHTKLCEWQHWFKVSNQYPIQIERISRRIASKGLFALWSAYSRGKFQKLCWAKAITSNWNFSPTYKLAPKCCLKTMVFFIIIFFFFDWCTVCSHLPPISRVQELQLASLQVEWRVICRSELTLHSFSSLVLHRSSGPTPCWRSIQKNAVEYSLSWKWTCLKSALFSVF